MSKKTMTVLIVIAVIVVIAVIGFVIYHAIMPASEMQPKSGVSPTMRESISHISSLLRA